jgi:hypothetical protein
MVTRHPGASPMAQIKILLALLGYSSIAWAQSIYINQVSAYSDLDSCAEPPLSTVVRDMYSGCGDGGRLTSYSCFCTASSEKFASIISTAVLKACPGSTDDADSATSVFSAYCQLGAVLTTATSTNESPSAMTSNSTTVSSTTASTSTTSSISSATLPASSQSSSTDTSSRLVQNATQTITILASNIPSTSNSPLPTIDGSSALASTSHNGSSLSKGVIAAIVAVAVVLFLALFLFGGWWYRKRRLTAAKPPPYEPGTGRAGASSSMSDDRKDLIELGVSRNMIHEMSEVHAENGKGAVELSHNDTRVELPVSKDHLAFHRRSVFWKATTGTVSAPPQELP